jgi:polysaccharide transporter, PST family
MSVKKRLIENMTSLFILQGLIYLFPLITYPYLIRVLGPEKFGLLAFAQALIQYFNIFTDYGFNMTVPREIAIHREDADILSSIFITTMLVKLGLLFFSAIVYAVIIIAVPYFHNGWAVYLIYFLAVIGNVFTPIWFFQGLEQMKYITLIIFIARVIMTVSTLVFVRSSEDIILAACFQAGITLLCAFLSLGLLWQRKLVKPYWKLDWTAVKTAAKESNQVFLSNLSISLYSYGSVLIVGLVSGQAVAGYYSIVQKFSSAVVGLVQPITQGFYPYLSRQFQDSQSKYYESQRLLLISGIFIGMILGSITFIFAQPITKILIGSNSSSLTMLIQIFSATTSFIILNIFLQSSILVMKLYTEMQSLFLKIAVLFLGFAFPVVYQFGYEGMAYLILATEAVVSFNILRLLSVTWNNLSFEDRSGRKK